MKISDEALDIVLDTAILVLASFADRSILPEEDAISAGVGVTMLIGALTDPPEDASNGDVLEAGGALIEARMATRGGVA